MRTLAVLLLLALAVPATAQESEITGLYSTNIAGMSSTQQTFAVDWAVSEPNTHCGIQFTDSLEGPWIDLFWSNCWNTVVADTSATRTTPPIELNPLFYRIVASRDDLGYPAVRMRLRVCNQSTSQVVNTVLGMRATTGAQHAVSFADTAPAECTPYNQFEFEVPDGLLDTDYLWIEGSYEANGSNTPVSFMIGGFRNTLVVLDGGWTNEPPPDLTNMVAPLLWGPY